MKQQFAQARANAMAISNLEKKLAAQASISKSGEATADGDVIDLISQSAASLQKSQPSILPSSPISVASTPSQAGNGGSAPGFSHLSSGSHPSPPRLHFPRCSGSPRNRRVSMGEAQRMSIRGLPLCVITLPLWGVVMHSRSRIP